MISFDDIEVFAQLRSASSPRLSTVTESLSSIYLHAYLAAILYPAMMLVGCTFILINSLALLSNSAARITTEVVPSPTSLSWSWANWTRRLAIGCSTYNFCKMVAPIFYFIFLPSLVIVTYPMSSTIILSRPCGPRDERTIFATDIAAFTTNYHCKSYHCCHERSFLILFVLQYLLLTFLILNLFKFLYQSNHLLNYFFFLTI